MPWLQRHWPKQSIITYSLLVCCFSNMLMLMVNANRLHRARSSKDATTRGASSGTAAEHVFSWCGQPIWWWNRKQCTSTEEATILTLRILHAEDHFSIGCPASASALYATGIHRGSVCDPKRQCELVKTVINNDQFKCLRPFVNSMHGMPATSTHVAHL